MILTSHFNQSNLISRASICKRRLAVSDIASFMPLSSIRRKNCLVSWPVAEGDVMSKVVFYARPGAVRDVEQKAVLAAAGYEVEARDLIAEHWTSASLRAFFDERPIVEWFDPAEPRVVSGEIDPGKLNAQEALVTLALDPRLINGPLVRYNGSCAAGLDSEQLREFMDTRSQAGKSTPVRRLPRTWGEAWSGN
jgi:nitrogenase-associated protein